jgi:hypothetical protein
VPDEPYRAPMPVAPDPYMVAWRRLRRLERRGLWFVAPLTVGFLIWIATMFVFILPQSDLVARGRCSRTATLLMGAYTVALAIATAPIAVFRSVCPRCGYSKLVWPVPGPDNGAFERRRGSRQATCRHCGIVVGTPKSAAVEAEDRAGGARPEAPAGDASDARG